MRRLDKPRTSTRRVVTPLPAAATANAGRPTSRTRSQYVRRPPGSLPLEADDGGSGRPEIDFSGWAVFERLFVRMPVRLLRAGNNVLDLLFYDVHAIPAATRRELLRWSDPDGSILVVHPGDGERRDVAHFEHVDDFLASADAARLDVVAIAGVGSSALGTAALAANAADALRRPVVGVVSGYGLADAFTEGVVGWFVLRPANRMRQLIDLFVAPLTPLLRTISADTQPNGDPRRLVAYVRGLPESDSLARLLARPGSPVAIVVGHSKGNLSIATALDNLSPEQVPTFVERLAVTTLGALVELPASLGAARQFIGALDLFGLINSTLPQAAMFVPWATHTLNTHLPFHLAARELVARTVAHARTAAKVPATAPLARAQPRFEPGRLVADWLDLVAGAATAIDGALAESARSLGQASAHVLGTRVPAPEGGAAAPRRSAKRRVPRTLGDPTRPA